MNGFREISYKDIKRNPFAMIGDEWMLITAGNEEKYNTMTASWGSVGILWGKPVAITYVRPQRYTYEFMETCEYSTLSFYDEAYRSALQFCGSRSGRDYDKAKETGLTPLFVDGTAAFAEANLILVCKKLYFDDLEPSHFSTTEVETACYPDKDYHRVYVSEICKVYEKE